MTGGGRPAPCTRRINGNGNGNVKCALSVGWRGGSGCGGRRQPIHGGLVAACSCALSCAHGKTGVGRPAQPARPLTVSCGRPPRKKERRATAGRALRLLGAEHGYAGRPDRHPPGRRASDVGSGSCRCLQLYRKHCRTKQKGRGERRVLFVFLQFVSNQCSRPPSPGNCRRWDGCRWRDRPRHGCRGRAYRDVLAACPAIGPLPAKPAEIQSRF